MAVVINGTTGIDKVQDGSIGTAKIAANAITSAKLVDGTITNADISATAGIVGTKLGAGAILQTVVNSGVTITTSTGTNNTFYDTVVSAAITPISTTSRMYLSYFSGFAVNNNSSNGGYSTRIQRTISGVGTIFPQIFLHDSGGNAHGMLYENSHSGPTMQYHVNNFSGLDQTHGQNTNVMTYTMQASNFAIDSMASGRGNYGATWNMTIMEIEQ
jgi:hypothetical protein